MDLEKLAEKSRDSGEYPVTHIARLNSTKCMFSYPFLSRGDIVCVFVDPVWQESACIPYLGGTWGSVLGSAPNYTILREL